MDTKALRQKILDLAIRGKLVPQDPSDEPASVLLERIRAEKQKMVKEGKLKAKDIKNDSIIYVGEDNLHYEKFADGSVKCIENEIPFDLPERWEWVRLQSICSMSNGVAKRNGSDGTGTIVLRLADLGEREISFSDTRSVILTDDEIRKYALFVGDVLFIRVNGSKENVGKSFYFDNESFPVAYCDHLIRCTPTGVLRGKLLSMFMRCGYVRQLIDERMVSAAGQNTISQPSLATILLPVPPLKEQDRISHRLNNADNYISQIYNSKQRLADLVLHTKAKILDLAIRGQLVPQDPNDEPASVLLERIRAEKEELIRQGKIKRDKKESIIFRGEDNSYYEKVGSEVCCIDAEIPFEVPATWVWTRLESCCIKEIRRGKAPKYVDKSGVLVFAQKCNTKHNGIDIGLSLYLDVTTLGRYPDDEYMQDGDVVINSTGTGTLGRVGLYRVTDNVLGLPMVPDSHVTIIRAAGSIQALYLYTFLKAHQWELEKKGEGSTNQKELKPLTLKKMFIALPPISEQRRIEEAINISFSHISAIEKSLS